LSSIISAELHAQHRSNKAELTDEEPPEIHVKQEPVEDDNSILQPVKKGRSSRKNAAAAVSAPVSEEALKPAEAPKKRKTVSEELHAEPASSISSLPLVTPGKRPKRGGTESAAESEAEDGASSNVRRSTRKPVRPAH
jgi:hypothetical protein